MTVDRDLFERKFTKGDGCWVWNAAKTKNGYGKMTSRRHGKTFSAHRISYEFYVGEISDGLSVLHRCDNRACVNPDHLWLGTQKENLVDMARKGRQAKQKLRLDEVVQIKKLRSDNMKFSDIAARFGVHIGTIEKIIYRQSDAWSGL
jgi:hypothetical protein